MTPKCQKRRKLVKNTRMRLTFDNLASVLVINRDPIDKVDHTVGSLKVLTATVCCDSATSYITSIYVDTGFCGVGLANITF